MSNTCNQLYSMNRSSVETVSNGHKRNKRGTKQCGTCFGYAQNNKQLNCFDCAKNGAIISNWLKAKKKDSCVKLGKVCPRIGCNWSTKGNRTLFCGRCATPFPSATKRKPYKRKAEATQKVTAKKRKKSKFVLSSKAGQDLKILTEDSWNLEILPEETEEPEDFMSTDEMSNDELENILGTMTEEEAAELAAFDSEKYWPDPLDLDIFTLLNSEKTAEV